ncbi:hypothetical protein BHM03_00052448 [Ensete ventricosum]|nr:hypothetical protein BHM03_00052448 [Ensete ventricosum]
MGGTYRSTSRLVHESLAIGRYHGFSPVPSDTGLYWVVMVEISTITAWYRSVTIDFDRCCPLSGGISLAAVGYGRRSLDDFSSVREEENETSSSPRTGR